MSSIFDEFFNHNKENRKPGEIDYKNDEPKDVKITKARIQVYGVVQGVGFRFTTKKLADDIGINGIVQNESDGSVYIEATGNSQKMQNFIDELAKGPSPSANVDKVVIEYDNSLSNYNGFSEQY